VAEQRALVLINGEIRETPTGDTIYGASGGSGSGLPYGLATGTDTYAVTISGYTLTANDSLVIEIPNDNTTASTLNVNGGGAVPITKDGVGLSLHDLLAGGIYVLFYDGTKFIVTSASKLHRTSFNGFPQVTSGTAFTITLVANNIIQRDISGVNQTNTSYIEFVIPEDFIAFPPTAINIEVRRNGANPTQTLTWGKNGVADATLNAASILATGTTNVWETKTVAPTDTYLPGDRIILTFTSQTNAGGASSVGLGLIRIEYIGR
jgi:hypothetical protein